jgi:phi LC3 family holin
MINWKVRFRQKSFLVGLFSALLLFAQQIAKLFGYELATTLGDNLTEVFNTILSILTILGVVVDPTTDGVSDSIQALKYKEPK